MMTYEEEVTQLLDQGRFFGGLAIKHVSIPKIDLYKETSFDEELISDFGINKSYSDYLYLVRHKNEYYVVGLNEGSNRSFKVWDEALGEEWQCHNSKNVSKDLVYELDVKLSKVRDPESGIYMVPIDSGEPIPEFDLTRNSYFTKPISGILDSVPKDWKYNLSISLDGRKVFRMWDFSKWPNLHENEQLFNGYLKLFVCGPWKFDKCNSDSNVDNN